MKRIALLGLIGLLPFTSFAVDKNGAYAPKGIGQLSCEQIAKIVEKEQKDEDKKKVTAALSSWLDGYITAQNLGTAQTFDIAPWASPPLLIRLIDIRCSKDPKLHVAQIAQELVGFLGRTRLQTKSEMVEIKDGDKSIGIMYAEVLKRAQQSLKDKGMFSGTPDGKWGSKTRDAFKAFQKKQGQGLEETGLPDSLTLFQLFQTADSGQNQAAPQ